MTNEIKSNNISISKSLALLLVAGIIFWTGCKEKPTQNLQVLPDLTTVMKKIIARHQVNANDNFLQVVASGALNQTILKGNTNEPVLKISLFRDLDSAGINYLDSIKVKRNNPDSAHLAIVTISVANFRKTPGHVTELVTQSLMGTPLVISKTEEGWFWATGPDNYTGWVDDDGIELMERKSFDHYKNSEKIIFTQLTGIVSARSSDSSDVVSDLVMGDILQLISTTGMKYHVMLPDGRTGYIPRESAEPMNSFKPGHDPAVTSLVKTARSMIGIPYLWGGTSTKGMDCSGFTKTIFFINGIILPRDADQQALAGLTVDENRHFNDLQPGDLLFFGLRATKESPERISHVGMWIGNMQYIQSSGMVKINSMDSLAWNFSRYNYKRYVRAKRVAGIDGKGLKHLNELFNLE